MPTIQKGICAEPNLHSSYLMFNVVDDNVAHIRAKLADMLGLFERYDSDCYEAMLSGVIAVGTGYWLELYPQKLPDKLTPFPDFACEQNDIPVSPADLFIMIRADRLDVCYEVSQAVCQLLGGSVELIEQTSGFRFYDGRDLTGFIIAPTSPQRVKKLKVCAVGEENHEFSGGSYIHTQRYTIDVDRWNSLSVEDQEAMRGYTKLEGKLLNSNSLTTEIMALEERFVQHTMSYGDIKTQGLFFVSCGATPMLYHKYIDAKLNGNGDVQCDPTLDYFHPVNGAAFFAPSVEFIHNHAAV